MNNKLLSGEARKVKESCWHVQSLIDELIQEIENLESECEKKDAYIEELKNSIRNLNKLCDKQNVCDHKTVHFDCDIGGLICDKCNSKVFRVI